MTIKEQYKKALENHKYNDLIYLLIKNLTENIDYKSISDFGTYLCDVDSNGLNIKLNEEEAFNLGRRLLSYSYYNNPDVCNAFALQMVNLERSCNYKDVIDMLDAAMLLDNALVLNNIAYAKYKEGLTLEALDLQKYIVQKIKSENVIVQYNLMLYELFCNCDIMNNDYKLFLNMLISDDVYDYESAVLIAIVFDDFEFVKNNLGFITKTFILSDDANTIINNYITNREKPTIEELSSVLQPMTCYENNFYLLTGN